MRGRFLGRFTVTGLLCGGCFASAPAVDGGTAASDGSEGTDGDTRTSTDASDGATADTGGSDDAPSTDDPSASGTTAHTDGSGSDTDDTVGDESSGGGTTADASTGDASVGESGGSGSTGDVFDFGCIDEDLGSAAGLGIADGSTNGADDSYAPACVTGQGPDRMLLWTAPANGTYGISTIGSSYDTGLAVLMDDCNGTEIACNDDSSASIVQSNVTVGLAQGESIVIVVDGYMGDSGPYSLSITSL